jgi:hypothetical protein
VTFDNAGNFLVSGSVEQKLQAEECLSYIEGVVNSLPAGKDFHRNERVKASQYVDVIFNHLKAHPESRDMPAFLLCKTALAEAFGDGDHCNKR